MYRKWAAFAAAVVAGLCLVPGADTRAAWAQQAPPASAVEATPVDAAPEIRGVRTAMAPRIDGRVSEPAWRNASVYDAFVESFPIPGGTPSEATELRVLYDDDHLYVAVICFDSQPSSIDRSLGRRDRPPASDLVSVIIDATHDHRTAHMFTVNAGGVLRDSVITEDTNVSDEWDGMWDGAAAPRPDGWSAELMIPLRLLRMSTDDAQVWGLGVRRELVRTHETFDTSVMPRNTNAFVSRLPHLVGLAKLEHRRSIVLTPYVATRLTQLPQYSDPARPAPRLTNLSGDVGVDVQARLASDLHLVGAINPDFGQVEADEIVVNLTTFEPFFPEKRPFFTQGMTLFEPVGSDGGLSPQRLLYSRRIGLETPIFAAAKVTGSPVDGLEIGLLDVPVMTPADPGKADGAASEDDPDRRYRFHPRRPLHFGPNSELPAQGLVQNYFAGVARAELGRSGTVGAAAASATPLGSACDPTTDPACPLAGSGATLDWNLGDASRTWVVLGQVGASRAGGPAARVLDDGTTLDPGDFGGGGFVRGGKLGGEPLRFELGYVYSSPQMDFNATGFQQTQNEGAISGSLQLVRSAGFGPIRDTAATVAATLRHTTDGRRLPRGHTLSAGMSGLLPGYNQVDCELGADVRRIDVREITGAGIGYERPSYYFGACSLATDPSRALAASLDGYVDRSRPRGRLAARVGGQTSAGITFRPWPWFETQANVALEAFHDSPNFLARPEPTRFQFGQAETRFLSVTARQLIVLTPRLTLQGAAQLFTGWAKFAPFYEATAEPGQRIAVEDLQPIDNPVVDPSFDTRALNINLVGRWEYRLGSTLFLVYRRTQQGLPRVGEAIDATYYPHTLLAGRSVDVVLVKWSYAWAP